MGSLKANEMLFFNKTITATEACKLGLVTSVLPDANFQSEVWPKLKEWSELPQKVSDRRKHFIDSAIKKFTSLFQSLVHSKELSRQFDRELLHKVNAAECDRLLERWQSSDCMEAVMKFFSKNAK